MAHRYASYVPVPGLQQVLTEHGITASNAKKDRLGSELKAQVCRKEENQIARRRG